MSHFTVLVIGENVEKQLEPFDENIEVPEYTDGDGEMTTYNPRSKWDWWVVGGRWENRLIQKDGVGVNATTLGALDIEATSHTFAILKNGEWHERGDVGWFGMVAEEKAIETWKAEWRTLLADLPADTPLTLIDAHI